MKIKTLYDNLKDSDNSAIGGEDRVNVNGWIRSKRMSKEFGFIELNDGSCFKNLQVVVEKSRLDNFLELSKLNVGASLRVEGSIALTPDSKQPFELKAERASIEGASAPDYPLQKKRHSFEYLRTIPIFAPEQTRSRRCSECGLWPRRTFTVSLRTGGSYTPTRR